MRPKPERWNVAVWCDGATRPLSSKDYDDEQTANNAADHTRNICVREGWSLKVHVTPVLIQK